MSVSPAKGLVMVAVAIGVIAFLKLSGPKSVAMSGQLQSDFYAQQIARAAKENKHILIDFSGSDWCGWCVKLDNEVFATPDFQAFAQKEIVFIVADFPRKKKLPPGEQAANRQLSQQFGIRGFPTCLLFSPDGKLVGKTGYQAGGPKKYIAHLRSMMK